MTSETTGGVSAPSQPPGGSGIVRGLQRFGQSLAMKSFVLSLLALVLLIPLFMVWGLVQERERSHRQVVREIGSQWGAPQSLSGPLLSVPITLRYPPQQVRNKDGELVTKPARFVRRHVVMAPETLAVDGDVASETRKRGIYEAIVYKADLKMDVAFVPPSERDLPENLSQIHWDQARLMVAMSDMKGMESASVSENNRDVGRPKPGLGTTGSTSQQGFHVLLDMSSWNNTSANARREFSIDLTFRGSQSLSVAPVGADSTAQLRSDWPHPGFSGAFLPGERTISEDGFSAQWAVPELARSIARTSVLGDDATIWNSNEGFTRSAFGVRLVQPVDHYRYVDRATKYGILFIGVTLLIIFAIEILSRGRMHVVHYAMAGMMVVMFYVLLLALAEVVGFQMAYGLAAGATGGVLAAFTASVFKGRMWALAALGSFAGLYGALYVILSLEDVALLAGAIAGFVILTVMMFVTRKVDWSAAKASKTT